MFTPEYIKLGVAITGWYAFSALATVYNKLIFNDACACSAAALTLGQMLAGALCAGLSILSGVRKYQAIDWAQARTVAILSLSHVLGNLFTNLSISSVPASLTHTIKAAEPVAAVVLAKRFLGEQGSPFMYFSLGVIVLGVGMASSSKLSFNWLGLFTALCSNLAFSSRNVLSKSAYGKHSYDETNLFFHMSWIGAVIFIPFSAWSFLFFGINASNGVAPNLPVPAGPIPNAPGGCYSLFLFACVFHFAYNQLSFLVLSTVSPVTHAVANCLKRAVVILSALLYFQTPVSPASSMGTALALSGVGLYSKAKLDLQEAKKAAAVQMLDGGAKKDHELSPVAVTMPKIPS